MRAAKCVLKYHHRDEGKKSAIKIKWKPFNRNDWAILFGFRSNTHVVSCLVCLDSIYLIAINSIEIWWLKKINSNCIQQMSIEPIKNISESITTTTTTSIAKYYRLCSMWMQTILLSIKCPFATHFQCPFLCNHSCS